jgi:hypothetical protein
MIHVPAAVIEQTRDHTITVSSELFRQCDNIRGKPFFIRQATRHLALRRTMLAECAANPALAVHWARTNGASMDLPLRVCRT